MDFNFKKFENQNQRFEDRITVTNSNSFGFPTKFYKDHNISQFKYAVLYYDSTRMAVGIQFTNSDKEKFKFRVLKSGKGFGGSVLATSFFKTYNITASKYHGRYNWEEKGYPGIGTLFIIILKERVSLKNDHQEHKPSPDASMITEHSNNHNK
jgi:hypothetical protein